MSYQAVRTLQAYNKYPILSIEILTSPAIDVKILQETKKKSSASHLTGSAVRVL
jgi:hypothetical protein